jgi:DNA-binding transcriptional regulator PaaX
MKLLKRLILFTLASEVDFFNKTEGFDYKSYRFLYHRLMGYQESSIRDAALQLVGLGEVDKIVRNEAPLFRLTSRGRDRLLSFFILSIGQKRVWDNIWRVVLIGQELSPIKSNKANKSNRTNWTNELRTLKTGLKKLGFRMFSRGVYLSPLPISARLREYLLHNNASAATIVIESRQILVGDDQQLAKEIWQLTKIEEEYQLLISRINQLLSVLKSKKVLNDKEKNSFSAILTNYFSLLENDPGLPKKLLSPDWPLELVKEKFLKLAARLREWEENGQR